jgi:hypothetical protein
MKISFISVFFASILMLAGCNMRKAGESPVADKPPMGWNSFDAFDCNINEQQFKEQVDFMADSLLKYGWNYAVIDYIWWHPDPGSWGNTKRRFGHPNIRYATDGKPLDQTTIDEYGRLLPSVERFPSAAGGKGFRPIADYVHSKGLKFGIHIMRGIHRYASYYNLPVKGTNYHLADITDKSDTCNWCNHMYGIDTTKAGAQEYYNSLFELYASWQIDFVKVDDILSPEYQQGEIEMIRKAIDRCGRPMVLSLSPGEAPLSMAEHLAKNANMWRVSADFWDEWDKLKHNFELLDKWSLYIKQGAWPDGDMLPVGHLSNNGRPHGLERESHFTRPEHYTLFTLWSISRSPLILGGDLPHSSDSLMFFLTNPEVIAVNQNSTKNRQLFRDENKACWIADDPVTGGKYVALFNLSDSLLNFEFNPTTAGLAGTVKSRDLWNRIEVKTSGGQLTEMLQPHGAALYLLTQK